MTTKLNEVANEIDGLINSMHKISGYMSEMNMEDKWATEIGHILEIKEQIEESGMTTAQETSVYSIVNTSDLVFQKVVHIYFNNREMALVELSETTTLKAILNIALAHIGKKILDNFTFSCFVSRFNVVWPINWQEVMREEVKGDVFRKCVGRRMADLELHEICQGLKADINDEIKIYLFLRQIIRTSDPEETNEKVWSSLYVKKLCGEDQNKRREEKVKVEEKPTKKDDAKPTHIFANSTAGDLSNENSYKQISFGEITIDDRLNK